MADDLKNTATDDVNNQNGQGTDTGNAGNEPEKKYTDDDVNNISKKNVAKAEKKLLESLGITDKEEAKRILAEAKKSSTATDGNGGSDNNADNAQIQAQLAEAVQRADNAVLENVLLQNHVKAEKVEKAVKLIDRKDCLDEDGKFSKEKADAAVKELLKDWGELVGTKGGDGTQPGFKIGSDGTEHKTDASEKKAVVQKSWNRFNN